MTIKGEVSNIEYAQQRSATREVAELILSPVLANYSTVLEVTHQYYSHDTPCRWHFECLDAGKMKDEEAR